MQKRMARRRQTCTELSGDRKDWTSRCSKPRVVTPHRASAAIVS
jgi:hypothetical protein